MKIIILLRRDADDLKGEMIAAHNRTKELLRNFPDADIQVLVLREYFNSFFCKIRGVKQVKKASSFGLEGITYKALWFNFSPIDNILVKLHRKPFAIFHKLNRFVKYLKDADIVIAHSTYAGYVALQAKQKYNIPYTVTWHGTDIHTTPVVNSFLRKLTIDIISNADVNCFVSKDLMMKSESLSPRANKDVLYNGVDREKFRVLPKVDVDTFCLKNGIDRSITNIAFIGNLYHVKNVLSLPSIYGTVKERCKGKRIVFHFVGDGSLRSELERLCREASIDFIMWGNRPADLMPYFINSMNLVVLPSLNEGLPLVSLESISCGVAIVGSRVGGIPEAIGFENTVVLDNDFTDNMANLIIDHIERPNKVVLGEQFSWQYTGRKELEMVNKIIGRKINRITL